VSIIGTTIRLDDAPRQVISIVPAGADFGLDQIHARAAYHGAYSGVGDVDAWIPLQASEKEYPRDTHPFFIVGRLTDRASLNTASDELTRIAVRLEGAYRSNTGRGVFVESLEDVVFAPVRPVIYLLLGAVALVLLVACVNVANLLLARGAARAREVAVRAALGASFSRLGQQFLVESLLLSLVGGALGVALAWAALRALIPFLPSDIPRVDGVTIDAPVLLATLATSVVVGIAFGLLPTWQALRVDVNDTLKGEGRGTSHGVRRKRLRETLVVGELAMSVMLVLCAGLMLRSVWSVLRVNPGFDADGVLKAEFTLPAARYPRDVRAFPRLAGHAPLHARGAAARAQHSRCGIGRHRLVAPARRRLHQLVHRRWAGGRGARLARDHRAPCDARLPGDHARRAAARAPVRRWR
jgi:putative ABC transport system permease protein